MAKSILVVDYDPKRIETTTRPFTEAGYRVEVARDGVAGVEAFARLHPDLVLVEMMLPKRHGFEVCQEFRKLRPGKKTPVLILGSTQAERYRMQAIGAGASDYLVRPVPDERLLEICRGLLENPNQDLPAEEPKASEPIRLEDSLPDFFKEPARPAPVAAPRAAAPLLDLGGLSDDEISARLDALLPSETPPRPKKPHTVAPATVPAAKSVEPPRPESRKPRVEAPPEAAPKAVPPVVAHAERPAPRARLPQTEPVLEPPVVETPRRRSGVAWPVVAAVGLIAVIGGWYGWRAATSDATVAERAALDATDFAPVSAGADAAVPLPTPVEPVSEPAFVEPEAEPVRLAPSVAAPVPTSPAPRGETAAPAPQRVEPVERPAPPVPQQAAPAPTPVEEQKPVDAPVEADLALPSNIVPIEGIVPVPAAQPEPARPTAGTVPGSIVDLAETDSPPVAMSRTAPAYPPVALRMRREGRVAVRLLVDENGTVADAVAADASAPADFAGEAVKAARNWRYRPAKKDGVPVKVWITEVIAFKL